MEAKLNKLLMLPVHFMKKRPKKLWYHPLKLDVEATTRCNMSCDFCYRKYLKNLPKKDLKPDVFERVLEVFSRSELIDFVGLGEPLLNRNFSDEVSMAKDDGRKVRFVTNGTLIDSKVAERIVSLGVDELYVSLDAIRPGTSEAIGRGDPDSIISGITDILSQRKSLPKITVQTLIMKENARELVEIGDFVKKLGLRWALLHPFCLSEEASERFHVFDSGLESFVEEANKLEGFEVSKRTTFPIRGKCYAPWNIAYINTKGDVSPCCFLGTLLSNRIEDWFLASSRIEVDLEEYRMGNVNSCEGIWDIWNSEGYQELREKLSKWQAKDDGQRISIDDFGKMREQYESDERFSYCKICQDRFGVAC